ncbi:hypothetical protein G6O69_18125 [Pseudenhygromyxa sp. WMMC2535]|uniref:hypothetical protein n=1 Tax=Pseudenhygromyxa sp. WMMC2535 TaxID=2712867 RepID=UPI001557F7CA|nr:hypothetical protein [Pseudenhygromyxa sp. WMMC2535]NVB39767.1 hypothetical protein [Pseudenhygromyxa sp. WMMC2535]
MTNPDRRHSTPRASTTAKRARGRRRPGKLAIFALLLLPLTLLLHAPLLAIVPGALLTVAGLEALDDAGHDRNVAPPALVAADDIEELARVAAARPIASQSRRVSL